MAAKRDLSSSTAAASTTASTATASPATASTTASTTAADEREGLRRLFEESIRLKQAMLTNNQLEPLIAMAGSIVQSIIAGGKLMLCGNGGSAADAQHLAAELLVRLRPHINRDGIPALALAMDSSTMTACGNDFAYEVLYQRMLCTLGRSGDVLLGITTSGRSRNVNLALRAARGAGITTLGFLGGDGGEAQALCDHALIVPSARTGRIQEVHITAGHALMELIEDRLISAKHVKMQETPS